MKSIGNYITLLKSLSNNSVKDDDTICIAYICRYTSIILSTASILLCLEAQCITSTI